MVCPTLIESMRRTYLIKRKIKTFRKKKVDEFTFFFCCLRKFNQTKLVIIVVGLLAAAYAYLDVSVDTVKIEYYLSNIIFFTKKDNSILEFIAYVTNIIAVSIPLIATFYYFIYKEQKTLSESSLNVNGNPVVHFAIVTIATFIIGKHLQLLIGNYINNSSLNFESTSMHIGKIIFFFVMLVIYTYRVCRMINYFLDKTNVRLFLEKIMEDVSSTIELLFQGSSYLEKRIHKSNLEHIYSKLNCAVEGTYQLLLQTINKDMIEVYQIQYPLWSKTVTRFFIGDCTRKGESIQREDARTNLLLLNENPKRYSMMYKNILKNHLSLIMTLYGKNKMQDGYIAIKDFFKLSPEGDVAYDEVDIKFREKYSEIMLDYLSSMSELSLFLYKNDHVNIYPIIEEIKSLPIYRIGIRHIICFFRIIIIKIIEKNDIKMLVHLVYALMNLIDIHKFQRSQVMITREMKEQKGKRKTLQEKMKSRILKTLQQSTSNSDEESNDITGMCMYVLLNAALKSIEISHYSCAGFIIKYLVSNYPSEILNNSYAKLLDNKGIDIKLDVHQLGLSVGVRSFNINNITARYCLEKLTILLYGQQKFIKENNVKVNYIPTTYIPIDNIQIENIQYLFKKFKSSKIKYGLVYLEEDSFMKALEVELSELAI